MGKIRLDGLRKEYGNLVAVDGLDLTIPDGSYTMILGPSGCGKSTTLRMIAGLESPTVGDVFIDGEKITDKPPRKRDLSMVFQDLALWDHKTVRENIGFGLKMEGVSTSKRKEKIEDVTETLQISDKLDQSPSELSGGQQQRVALGRSLVREPDVILLDEPLSSLDAKLRLEMRAELSRIQQRIGTSFVHVTHNQEDAMSIADEILLLEDGQVQQYGDPIELFEAPNNEFVADFIGTPSMNLRDATVVNKETLTIDAGSFDLTLPSTTDQMGRVGNGAIRLGLRPSDIRLSDGTPTEPFFDATVAMIETFGDTNWYYLDVGNRDQIVMKSADEEVLKTVESGDEITVSVQVDDIHLFDPETGEAIT